MAPMTDDDNINLQSVRDGLDVAEDEAREAAAEEYDEELREIGEGDEIAGEEDFEDERPADQGPELGAIHDDESI